MTVDPLNLQFASDRLKDDKSIVLATVKELGGMLDVASNRLKQDSELIELYLKEGYELEDLYWMDDINNLSE